MKRCKDCKKWVKTDVRPDIINPSGKCNGRYNQKDDGWGTHADEESCYDFEESEIEKCEDCKWEKDLKIGKVRGCPYKKICEHYAKSMYDPKWYIRFMFWRKK